MLLCQNSGSHVAAQMTSLTLIALNYRLTFKAEYILVGKEKTCAVDDDNCSNSAPHCYRTVYKSGLSPPPKEDSIGVPGNKYSGGY